jgi:DNA-binding NtrC family response regulator
VKRVLLAEPSSAFSESIAREYAEHAQVVGCRDFRGARARLLEAAPDVLVTNLRLADYNGLHLVLLMKATDARATCIVHTDRPDLLLVREAQSSGAFFERTERLPAALRSYLRASLPVRDRRNPETCDRRLAFRGGRRAADQAIVL